MAEFMRIAPKLAQNPLGIVALFVLLIYAVAALLFTQTAATITVDERWPILAFVIVFPFVVLWIFYKLVTKHHSKLYAPQDWQDERHFLQAMNIEISPQSDEPQAQPEQLEVIRDRIYGKETITIDGKRFEKCTFTRTRLKFRGTKPVHLVDCAFSDIKWLFGGNAALTFNFVSALYRNMGKDIGRPLLDSIVAMIEGQPGGPDIQT